MAFKSRNQINRQIQEKFKLYQKSPFAPNYFCSVVYYKITRYNFHNSFKIISLNQLGKYLIFRAKL